MEEDRVPLYVRVPREQAAALDRLADTTGRRKQQIVSDLLADRLEVGRVSLSDTRRAPTEVLTLEETAELLRLPDDAVALLAKEGELPGRSVGGEWRFARAAVLLWLSSGGQAPTDED